MERFGDDILGLILNWVKNPNDRKSFSQVCKQWLRVEGMNRFSLCVLEPDLLPNFLPRFPNVISFQSTEVITNTHVEFVAETCPKIETFNLNYKKVWSDFDESDDKPGFGDVDDSGLYSVAINCRKMTKVLLRRRYQIGNFGVISQVKFSQNLVTLDLGRCTKVSDEALEAIGLANCLQVLNLQGCWLITDKGLASLASGYLSKTLKKLVIAECDRITDEGLLHLGEFCCLEELNLAECGLKVTDTGGLAVAGIQTLEILNFSWLGNISDVTIAAVSENCRNLVAVDLTGCESITGGGIRAFGNHGCLQRLVVAGCQDITGEDLEELVFGCKSLMFIGLDRGLRWLIPDTIQENIGIFCWLDWM